MLVLSTKCLLSKPNHLFSPSLSILEHERLSVLPLPSQMQMINCIITPLFLETIKEIKAKTLQFIKTLSSSSYSGREGHKNQYAFHLCKHFNVL